MSKKQIVLTLLVILAIVGVISILSWLMRLGNEARQSEVMAPKIEKTRISRDMADSIKNELTNLTDEISGKVLSVSGGTITIEAEIIDPDRVAEASSIATLPLIKREYTVTANNETEFVGKKLADIAPGQTISVETYELVYETTRLTAARISDPSAAGSGEAVAFTPPIDGRIEKIEGNTLTVKSPSNFQNSDEKTYSVRVTGKTKLLKTEIITKKEDSEAAPVVNRYRINLSDIRTDDNVTVLPLGEAMNKTGFEARSVTITVVNER